MPAPTAARSSRSTSATGTPPWNFRARMVATTTATSGRRPLARHLMSMNFSAPRSAPKPASVIDPVAQLEGGPGGHHRVAAVGDVRERAAVDEGRRVLERLHQVRGEGVAQQHGHRAVGLQVAGGDLLLAAGVADDDVAEPALEVARASRPGRGSPSPRTPRRCRSRPRGAPRWCTPPRPTTIWRRARSLRSTTRFQVTVRGSMSRALPWCRWLSIIAASRLLAAAIGGEVAGEGEVDVDHRHDLAVAAAGRAALDAEHRPHRRLAQGDDALLAEAAQARRRGRPRSWSCPRRPGWGTSP